MVLFVLYAIPSSPSPLDHHFKYCLLIQERKKSCTSDLLTFIVTTPFLWLKAKGYVVLMYFPTNGLFGAKLITLDH